MVQERVLELVERLIANGIDVVIDVYDLKEGQDKYAFMERSVNDSTIDRVLVICDKVYTEKANRRTGGVGDETVIISSETYGKMKQEKFVPIIFEHDEEGNAYCPSYIKSRIYIDLSTEDEKYESEYEKLLRNIYEKPLYTKPPLGSKPEWLDNININLSSVRDVVKQIRWNKNNNSSKTKFLVQKAVDELVEKAEKYTLAGEKPIEDEILTTIEQSKDYRDLVVEFCEALIYSGMETSDVLASMFERLYNELHDATGRGSYSSTDFEMQNFLIWELFISITATLLHYEKYAALHGILAHTYFLRENFMQNSLHAYDFTKFRTYCNVIENRCKPKCHNPRLFTLSGEILVKREKKPILTKESISNADLVLYQLAQSLDIEGVGAIRWYPISYIYHEGGQPMWQKLRSKKFCEKIMPLFGAKTIEELKKLISKNVYENGMSYSGFFDSPLVILDNIKLEDIGTII